MAIARSSVLVARASRGLCSSSREQPFRSVGDVGHMTRIFTRDDVAAFAKLTGGDNRLRQRELRAGRDRFGGTVVHGMLYASMFGAIIGQRAPGAVYLSQSLAFRRRCTSAIAVTAEVSVERVGRAGRLLDFATRCTNEQGELVLDGSARCLLPAAGEPG